MEKSIIYEKKIMDLKFKKSIVFEEKEIIQLRNINLKIKLRQERGKSLFK